MPTLTILTPTYNRAKRLPALYASLLNQTCGDFDWLVVDDGSADDTRALVEGFQREGRLSIRYLYRENGGKHRALNTGIREIDAPLTFIVDSDDTLLPEAVEIIRRFYKKYGIRDGLCGYSFFKVYPGSDKALSKALPASEFLDTLAHARFHQNILGDMAEVWSTAALRKTPFPEFEGERFYPEDGVWLRISGPEKLVYTDIPVYVADYYEDGLTKNARKNKLKCPRGMMDRCMQLMNRACGVRANIRGGLLYCVYGRLAGYSVAALAKMSGHAVWVCLCCVPAAVIRRKWTRASRNP